MVEHVLKCWPQEFAVVRTGQKPFEYRKNDRDYKVCDTLRLREFDQNTERHTGEEEYRLISYVLRSGFGLAEGYVVLGLQPIHHPNLPEDVIELIISAREFWDANNDFSAESRALDKALEAFAERVPYENEPEDTNASREPSAAPGTAEEICRPAREAVSGGEPSEPSSDAGGAKMGGCRHPGRSDDTSGHMNAKSEQATNASKAAPHD